MTPLPPVSDELLAKLGKKRVPDWLRCPRFYKKDCHRPELEERRPGDIARLARAIAEHGGDVFRLSVFWGGETYYQSDVAPHAPGLGDIDYLREALDAASETGIRIVAYMNPNCLYDDHPLFETCAIRDSRGAIWNAGAYNGRFERCRYACVNHPAYREFLLNVIEEIFTRYEPAGLYVDGLTPHICFCEHCRAKYRSMFDAELPAKFERYGPICVLWEMTSLPEPVGDPSDPDSARLTEFLYRTLIDITRDFTETVKSTKPDAVAMYHSWPKPETLPYYDATLDEIYVREPWRHTLWKDGELASFGAVLPVPCLLNIALQHRTEAEARHKMHQAITNGVIPNSLQFHGMKSVFPRLRERAEYFDFARTGAVKFLAFPRTVVLDSVHKKIESEHASPAKGPRNRFLAPYVGCYSALLRSGLPIVTLHRPDFHEKLAGFQVLCLANEAIMTDAQAEAVRRFVAAGGGLVATHETSLYDETGRRRQDFALADVFGVTYERILPAAPRRIRFDQSHPVTDQDELDHDEPHALVRLTTGQAVAWTAGDGPNDEDAPAVVTNEYGPGRVVYLAGKLDAIQCDTPTPAIERLFARAVRWVVWGELPVEIDAAAAVGVTLFDQPERRLLHLVNHNAPTCGPYDSIEPIENVGIRMRIPAGRRVKKLHALWTNPGDIPFEIEGDLLKFTLTTLGEYEVVAAEYV